jgi:hypothetical protein
MSLMRVIVLVLTIYAISCEAGKLFDLNQMYHEGTLLGFLEDIKLKDGAPVTLEQCLDDPVFEITKMVVTPDSVIKGQNIKIKVMGIMTTQQTVSKLHLDTFYNGKTIYTDNVDKGSSVVEGVYTYDYEASVPTFTPAGKWEIYVYLLNTADEKLSCVKAAFTMP